MVDPEFYKDINIFLNRSDLFKEQLLTVKSMNLAKIKNIYNEWYSSVNPDFITVSNLNELYKKLDVNIVE
jgi:hypothetical protein